MDIEKLRMQLIKHEGLETKVYHCPSGSPPRLMRMMSNVVDR